MQEKRRGKIRKNPAQELVHYIIRPAIQTDLKRSYTTILDINRAHVLMLEKTGIIKKDVARKILEATAKIAAQKDDPQFTINPNIEDLYFNLERYLIELTGLEIGGQQHTARSRNDLTATEMRMDTRRSFIKLSEMFNVLRQSILDLAKQTTHCVMSGYTHMQPSEPITFAHYLCGVSGELERDYARLAEAWKRLNICPLGGCSMGSTSFPIDRTYTARLLGFDDVVQNSIDCVATRDYALEITCALATAANTLSRFALDLYNWSTPEYGYVEVDDSVAVCSSIMPQKKNPITLEHVKGKTAHLEGVMVSIFSGMKNVMFTHCRDISMESGRYFWTGLDESEAIFALMNVTVKTMKLKPEHMVEAARKNFCTVTELANYLVRHDGVSFREAHNIIAAVVEDFCAQGKTADGIDKEAINKAAKDLYGIETKLTDALIKEALDPVRVVNEKTCLGGTEPHEVQRQISLLLKHLQEDQEALEQGKQGLTRSANYLSQQEQELLQTVV